MADADRDRLAFVRTELANERTLLAWMRTALGLAGAGILVMKLSPSPEGVRWGTAGLALGFFFALVGMLRFVQVRRRIRARHHTPGSGE
jgi:putative membrane protein